MISRISLCLGLVVICVMAPCVVFAATPTVDQQGTFMGKGVDVRLYNLDEKKPLTFKGEFVLTVNADGSGVLSFIPKGDGGSWTIFIGTDGSYGSYRACISAPYNWIKLEYKGQGAKTSIQLTGAYENFIETYTGKLKKVIP